jgi:hypothetical protein
VVGIDAEGNCYAAGLGSINPTPGALQVTPRHSSPNQFLVKLDGTGSIVYATYLSGSGTDTPYGIAVDGLQNVYLTGSTTSNDFPIKNAYQPAIANPNSADAFITALNPAGTDLVYSTYLGGSDIDTSYAIAVDARRNAYVTGTTSSTNFPTVAPFQSAPAPGVDNAFVIKLDATGKPVYSTYLAGNGGAQASSIGVDATEAAYVTGTAGSGFPLVNPIQSSGGPLFVSKFNPTGSALVYSTYLGHLIADIISDSPVIAVDSADQAYVAGMVYSGGSVPLASPIQKSIGTGGTHSIGLGDGDGFVSVLNNSGTAVVFSTYLGGSNANVSGVGTDSSGNIYLGGVEGGPFPILNATNGVNIPLIPVFHYGFLVPLQNFFMKISPSSGSSLSYPATVDLRPLAQPVGGSSPPANVLVANDNASGDIAISNIAITGDFSETNNCPSTLQAATECEIQLIFTATAGGERTGTVTITDSAPGSPHVINLLGTGLVPQVSLSPTSLSFASQVVGRASSAQMVSVTNSGGTDLTISSISVSGDFSESNNCPGDIVAQGACTISVVFMPTTAGTRTGTLTIVDNAAGSPHTVSLSGTGANPSLGLGLAPGGSNTATVAAGNTASYALSLGGGGIGGMASISCTGAPQGAICNVPASEAANANTPANFNVSVSTTSRTIAAVKSGPLGWLCAIGILGCVLLPCSETHNRSVRRYLRLSPLVLILLFSSCGGSGPKQNPEGTPPGNYTLTVTAAIGASSQSITLTLQVQ